MSCVLGARIGCPFACIHGLSQALSAPVDCWLGVHRAARTRTAERAWLPLLARRGLLQAAWLHVLARTDICRSDRFINELTSVMIIGD